MLFFAMEQTRVTWMISWRMFNIQCEDIEVLRFSNTKSSMIYNLVTVWEARGSYWTSLLDKTTVQDVVWYDDLDV